ncbi:adenylate/guanylate cyclase domain-containing protein [Actinomycetospora cinnamomea]|uniref:Adenylate/guanylate cyclase family protein n=1 Tax=Actinomycetospora cinnamomea TaxID=663609 RepID=A0A2U1FII3_9PSEU|nr:adenylate/guanylate cyclase domain-containing protein [Actinomycetospora cinnamomea]PVZ11995.1 adenylate/guanylate cyclase family protein [Actinomycetospora cinnamomea]
MERPGGPLGQVVAALAAGRTAAQVVDAEGRLAWVSEQMQLLAGLSDEADMGIGQRLDDVLEREVWNELLTADAAETLRSELHPRLDDPESTPLWVLSLDLQVGGRHRGVGMLGVTLRHADGSPLGAALIYAPLLPARVLALVSEGDEAMFTRMADLSEPAKRPAAIVFADVDASGPLSRRLPTAVYFELIRGITTAFDELVGRHGGIVGKHAGDGASAYFLADDHGSDPEAACAALRTVQALPDVVAEVVADLTESGADVSREDCRLNIGAHWGADLFIGQVVTGGRLEVTALGDEVNECARVEQVATGGQRLVTKTLIERLDDAAAAALGLRPRSMTYRVLAELARDGGRAGGKADRDAGAIAVHDLGA